MPIDLRRAPRYLGRLVDLFRAAPLEPQTVLTVWRCVKLEWVRAGQKLEDASRSTTYAGRWHHPAESPALYTSDAPGVAVREAARRWRPVEFPVAAVVGRLEIRGRRVVRLDRLAAQLPWPLTHLLDDGKGYLRAILVGTAACRAGVGVLLVPATVRPQRLTAVCYTRHNPKIEVRDTVQISARWEELVADRAPWD